MARENKGLWRHRILVLDFTTSGDFLFKMAASQQKKLEDPLLKALDHLNLQSLTLREEQVNTIRNIVEYQKDVLVVFPTGFGKSLICHLLSFVFDSWLDVDDYFFLVVSPLNALMRDQTINLQNLQVPTLMVRGGECRNPRHTTSQI